jgi:hypothetical protein
MKIIKNIFGSILKWPRPNLKDIINKGKVLYLPRKDTLENIDFKIYGIGLQPWRILPYYSG